MVTITDRAASEVQNLLEKQNKPEAMLRVFVSGGGCSGFQYGMALEEEAMEGDATYDIKNVKVIIDPRSGQYLEGAEIDFVENMMGGGFKIENPNAASSCGCGSSFTPKEGEEGEAEPAAAGGGCGCGSGGCGSGGSGY